MNQQSEFVAAKIAEIGSEIGSIEKQIEALQGKKQALVLMKEALLPLLSKEQKQHPLSTSRPSDAVAPPINTGFRSMVRTAIQQHPKGLKPAELIQWLSE